MLFNVPQFIDIEDKIVGPFSAKQLGWLGLGGVILMVLWNFLDNQAFIIAAVIIGGIFGALAFYRPYGQPLIAFLTSSVYYAFRPRMYVWKRLPEKIVRTQKPKSKDDIIKERKKISENKIEELTRILDQK
jgi:hypothetical protein